MLRFRLLPILLALPGPLHAQSEAALREAFEGRQVTIKIAMPGTEAGIDIYPADAQSARSPEVRRASQGQRDRDPGRPNGDGDQGPGEEQAPRVPARRRRLRHVR